MGVLTNRTWKLLEFDWDKEKMLWWRCWWGQRASSNNPPTRDTKWTSTAKQVLGNCDCTRPGADWRWTGCGRRCEREVRWSGEEMPPPGGCWACAGACTGPVLPGCSTDTQWPRAHTAFTLKTVWDANGERVGERGGGAGEGREREQVGEWDPDRAEEFWLKHCCWLRLVSRLKTKYGVVRQSWIYGGGKAHCTLCARPLLPHVVSVCILYFLPHCEDGLSTRSTVV